MKCNSKSILARAYAVVLCTCIAQFTLSPNDAQAQCLGDPDTLYVAPDGVDGTALSNGSCSQPLATLAGANAWLVQHDPELDEQGDRTVYVRGGTYFQQRVDWTVSSSSHTLTIEAYPGEIPVFDGNGLRNFFEHRRSMGACTRIVLRGLTLTHYVSTGIYFGGQRPPTQPDALEDPVGHANWDQSGRPDDWKQGWNGCAIIEDNVLEEIGSSFDTGGLCPGCKGFGAVDLVNSRYNVVRGNVFYVLENSSDPGLLHAIYAAHGSSSNSIEDNYIHRCSGDPMRVRDGSDDNVYIGNYIDSSGRTAFSQWRSVAPDRLEEVSRDNHIQDNVVASPYPTYQAATLNDGAFVDDGQAAIYLPTRDAEMGRSVAAGDLDGDGNVETVAALDYEGFSVVLSTNGKDRFLRNVLYASSYWTVTNIVAADFDGVDGDELISVYRNDGDNRTLIHRDSGNTPITEGPGSLGQKLYESTYWDITALAAGDLDSAGAGDELAVAFLSPAGETRIYQSDGDNSAAANQLYSSTYYGVPAMAVGDLNGDGRDELVTAFVSTGTTLIYASDGMTSATGGSCTGCGLFYSTTSWDINAMAWGTFGVSATPSLVTAFQLRSTGENRLYRGDLGSPTAYGVIYSSTSWQVPALATVPGNPDVLVTAFQQSDELQIWTGDGVSSAVDTKHLWWIE